MQFLKSADPAGCSGYSKDVAAAADLGPKGLRCFYCGLVVAAGTVSANMRGAVGKGGKDNSSLCAAFRAANFYRLIANDVKSGQAGINGLTHICKAHLTGSRGFFRAEGRIAEGRTFGKAFNP